MIIIFHRFRLRCFRRGGTPLVLASRLLGAAFTLLMLVPTTATAANSPRSAEPLPAFRTSLPEITPDRWTLPPSPLPVFGTVARDDYAQSARRRYEPMRAKIIARAGDPQLPNQYAFARREAFLYQFTRDETYVRTALRFIDGDLKWRRAAGEQARAGFNVCGAAVETYLWLRECRALTTEDHELCRQWLTQIEATRARREYGAQNRAAGYAVVSLALMHWWPEETTPERKSYGQQVWHDWWEHRDTYENTSHYNSHWWNYVQIALAATGRRVDAQDPQVRALAERFLQLVNPMGLLPNWGDGGGENRSPGRWIAAFEFWADAYQDGRFKWVAHRIYEYVEKHHAEEAGQWPTYQEQWMDDMMRTYYFSSEAVKPRPPDSGSVLTYRHGVQRMSDEERKQNEYYAKVTGSIVPDKLIFRSGRNPSDAYAMVELAPTLGHGHVDPGAINSYHADGSVLLQDTSYMVRFPEYHNCFVAQPADRPNWWLDWDGLQNEYAVTFSPMQIDVPAFHASGSFAYAHIRMRNYLGRPITVHREIVFLASHGMWVHDTLEAGEKGFTGTVGPAWQATHIYGRRGLRWANLAQVTLPIANTQSDDFVLQWKNRPLDLLVAFPTVVAGAAMTIDDVTDTKWVDTPVRNTLARRLHYKREVALRPGERVSFDSVLVPHAPTSDATTLADEIEAVASSGSQTVVRLRSADGRTIWAGINAERKSLRIGPGTISNRAGVLVENPGMAHERWESDR